MLVKMTLPKLKILRVECNIEQGIMGFTTTKFVYYGNKTQ